jgi:hypothetical protein
VVELRIPDPPRRTGSGYFNDLDKLAQDAAALDARPECPPIYITLNPVKTACLSRAVNRYKSWAKVTTADHDILGRRWLFFDFDPIRPAGVSSTDAEHEVAIARATASCAWLVDDLGASWDSIVLADSGNGAHVLLRVDLANDAAALALATRCTESMAWRFTDPVVSVDPTTVNAARIIKLYGTTARKGDSTRERPHRQAVILRGLP